MHRKGMNKKVQKESSANDVEIEQLIYDSKDKCCGCSACAMACPKQCITMVADKEGFLYPQIDQEFILLCSVFAGRRYKKEKFFRRSV